MKAFFKNILKNVKNVFRRNVIYDINNIFNSDLFKAINYPLLINTNIVIIYYGELKKFYTIDFKTFDVLNLKQCSHPHIIMLNEHLKNRLYAENHEFIYHLQNLNEHRTIYYNHIGINNIVQKVLTKNITSEKELKHYLKLLLFEPSEPLINTVEDLY